jgi:hypothetical protein
MAGKKIAFATSNFDQASGKPSNGPWSEMSYPEFNAMRSSKFNAFSVPDLDKLGFIEGSAKAKLGIEAPNGSSKLIPVQIYNGSGTEVNIPKEEEGNPPGSPPFQGFEGTLFGNSDSFPVGNGTGWIEVDLDFLVKIFWRVKTWKASISGSFSSLSLSGDECNPENPNASANESALVSNEDVVLAEESDPISEEGGDDSDPKDSSNESLSFKLNQQSKQQILRSQPSHLGNSMSTTNNVLVTRNEIFILKVQGANNDKFFINPLSLYSFEATANKYKWDDFTPPDIGAPPPDYPGGSDCYTLPYHADWARGWSIQYRSTLSPIKESYIDNADESECPGVSKVWQGRKAQGYTLNINAGGDSRSYSMPLSYSANSYSSPAGYGDWSDEWNCEGIKPLLKSSLDSFPSPNITVTLEPHEYWEYNDGKGNAIWDKTTGEKLRDPITGA